MGLEGLIPVLLALLVIGILIYAAKVVLDMVPIAPPFKTLIWLILLVVALLWIFRTLGVV